jgi:CheY-like chemotaxis protein
MRSLEPSAASQESGCELGRVSQMPGVITATSGAEAISLLHAGGDLIELVITDLRIPSMSGEEFDKTMDQLSSPPTLLYISCGDPPPGAESAKFLQKPFTREALLRAVRVVLKMDQ